MLRNLEAKTQNHVTRSQALTDLFRTLLHQLMTARLRVDEVDLAELEIEGAGAPVLHAGGG